MRNVDRTSAPSAASLACEWCRWDGRKWGSRYGGNDPDVWDAGPCDACGGSGEHYCDDCGKLPAVSFFTERRKTFRLCLGCHIEWLKDEWS